MLGLVVRTAAAEDTASIKGKALFKGESAKYVRHEVPTDKDPNCKKSKAKIGEYAVILNKKDDPITIRNVLVSVKEGLGDKKFPPLTDPVKLTQFGCEYDPHVVAMMSTQPLKVFNGDDTNHNIHLLPAKNSQENFSQPVKDLEKGRELKLVAEPPFFVKCEVHPWMGCYIAVFDHPFFAVTGEEGTYEIKGLPPGKYVLEAWHEKLGTMTANVEVTSGETKETDFTFEPDKK